MTRNYEVTAVAGFDPATRKCRFVGRRHPEDVIEALDLGLVLVPVTVEQAREVFGQPMDRLMSVPRVGRLYLAGPMTGYKDFNFPAFNAQAEALRGLGYHVENPAEHGIVEGAEWQDYLRYDIGRLSTCEAIFLLPGWSKSKGAALEVHIAKALGMTFIHHADAEREQPSPAPELERPEVVTHSDDAAVDRFSASMKQKLEAARAKGRSGWDDPSSCDVAFLAERLIEHLGKGNAGTFEDVANFAMMLHQRGAHPQVLAEAAGAIERDYLRIIQAQEEKWSGRFEVLEDEAKTLRRERDAAQARVAELEQCLYQMQEAAKSLSAPVAELEKQEPVAWALQRKSDGFVRATWNQKPSETQYEIAELDGDVIVPLYAAPVAQAGQVPEECVLVRREAVEYLADQWPGAYRHFYERAQLAAAPAQGGE